MAYTPKGPPGTAKLCVLSGETLNSGELSVSSSDIKEN